MPNVVLGRKTVRLGKREFLGSGGEADVYKYGGDAVKIWKGPNHPDLVGDAAGQAAARQRLMLQQDKMPAFPRRLPQRVVVPKQLVRDKSGGKIIGYTMNLVQGCDELIRYGQKKWRGGSGQDNNVVMETFRDLHETLVELHRRVVIGDFNDLNIMVDPRSHAAYLIDADSFQFDNFLCMAYTAKFLDPRHAKKGAMQLDEPHDAGSDWYAYYVMLMQSLLFVGPYGGVYRPKTKGQRVTEAARPLHRITVFNDEVRYPKKGIPLAALHDDLAHEFETFFGGAKRAPFPTQLLEWPRWTSCTTCGIEHQLSACPTCSASAPVQQRPVQVVSGGLKVTEVMTTTGRILAATYQNGIRIVEERDGKLYREDGREICAAITDPKARYRVCNDDTYIGANHRLVHLYKNVGRTGVSLLNVADDPDGIAAFDTNADGLFRIEGNRLDFERPQKLVSPRHIGDVLGGNTRFWVGPKFGFGYYRAGELVKAFTFQNSGGLNDRIEIPLIRERLLGMRCYFTDALCWIFYVFKKGAEIVTACTVITSNDVQAHMAVKQGEGDAQGLGWLDMSIHGKVATGRSIFIATDDGLIRVDLRRHDAQQVKSFPDTEPWVEEGSELFLAGGIASVRSKSIHLLEMK